MTLAGLTTLVLGDLTQHSSENTISPFQSSVIETAIKLVLSDCFGIYDVALALYLISPFEGVNEYLPSFGLGASGRSHHHQTVV